jgi:hypothetical protein
VLLLKGAQTNTKHAKTSKQTNKQPHVQANAQTNKLHATTTQTNKNNQNNSKLCGKQTTIIYQICLSNIMYHCTI